MWFEILLGGMALVSLMLIVKNTRTASDLKINISRMASGARDDEEVFFEGERYEPIIYYTEDPVRDETGRLGERLSNLARGVRVNVTYANTLFRVDKGKLLSFLEDQISKAQFGYQATKHVRYSERIKFLKSLYNEVIRTHTPYVHRLLVIVWVPKGDLDAKARAEAFKSMVEAEAGVRLERTRERLLEALLPSTASNIVVDPPPSMFSGSLEAPGVIVGRDNDGRLVILDWPRDFETHVGVFGPTGRGKTVLLLGIASQLASMSDSRLDPFAVVVVDPKGDLARLLQSQASNTVRLEGGDCIPLPRLEGVVEDILNSILAEYKGSSITPCQGSLLRRGLTLFDLQSLPNEDRDIAASMILSSLAIEASEGTLPGKVVLVLDEAWRLSIGGARHMVWALREGRSKGLHIIYATQSPEDLPDSVLNNTGTLIVFGGYTRSYTEAARRLGLDDTRRLLELPVGSAYIKVKDLPPVEARVFGFHEYIKRVQG